MSDTVFGLNAIPANHPRHFAVGGFWGKRKTAYAGIVNLLLVRLLDSIIKRAAAANRNRIDAYVVVLISAHDERTKDFLLRIVKGDAARISSGARFHAAVGLAELGDPVGVEWMIERCRGGFSSVYHAPHVDSLRGLVSESCLHALVDLTGQSSMTAEEWREWWYANSRKFAPQSLVRLRYP